MDCSCLNLLYGVLISFGLYLILKFIYNGRNQPDKWATAKTSPKDVVTLHCFPASSTIPSPSPFVFKLLTFLRAAKIPYEIDEKVPIGPKGKSPWITLNGQQIADSEIIISFLSKKFEVNLNEGLKDEDLAIARSVRVMMEERWFWCMPLWRFVWPEKTDIFTKFILENASLLSPFLPFSWGRHYGKLANAHGIGRHEKAVVVELMLDDMRAVSKILGKKKFILGDQLCQDDCAIFGQLGQALWALDGSPYEELMKGEEVSNLREYCLRMKALYWHDWQQILLNQ